MRPPVTPEPLEFASDPRILRGTWTGKSKDGHTLLLELTANSPNEDGYKIEGTFQLDDKASVAIIGHVRVPITQTAFSVQTSVPCSVTAASVATNIRWEFCSLSLPEGSPPNFEIDLYRWAQDGTGVVGYSFSLTKTEDTDLLVQG